jgi:hypothetical protein
MKKMVFTIFALLYVSCICGQSKVDEAPDWFFTPPAGEYVGVSLPLDDQTLAQQQALRIALLSYLLQNDFEGELQDMVRTLGISNSANSSVETSNQVRKMSLCFPNTYKVVKTSQNRYGEIFVAIKVLSSSVNPNAKLVFEARREHTKETGKEEVVVGETKFLIQDVFDAKKEAFEFYMAIAEANGISDISASAKYVDKGKAIALKESWIPATYQYKSTELASKQRKVGLPKGKSFTPLNASLGVAYTMALLQFLSDKAYWDKPSQQEETFSATKRKATPIQSISIIDNELFIQIQTL